MRIHPILVAAGLFLLWFSPVEATVFYVDVNSINPTPPYTNWNTAATDIQSAVDASSDGDFIWVNDGVYQTGGRVVYGALTNRVVINKAVTVQSVNGPAATVIQGYQVPVTIFGDSAVRCVYMTNSATLSGFTLTNGATLTFPANLEDSGGGVWCESQNATITNCVVCGNSASWQGGGAYGGTLFACVLSNNLTFGSGGGASTAGLTNCLINNNQGNAGGGGVSDCSLNDCLVVNNQGGSGGGAISSILDNCTVVGNSATQSGGGDCQGVLYNCIVYYNSAVSGGSNYSGSAMNFCCAAPLPPSGTNNISSPPLFVNLNAKDFHLLSNSPCINLGNNSFVATATDLDGNSRIVADTVDMGVYEFPTPVPLVAAIQVQRTNVATGFAVTFQAIIEGGFPTIMSWDFNDGTVISNQSTVSHGWAMPATYTVTLLASNEFTPGGARATVVVNAVSQPVSYVNPNSAHPAAPYFSWDAAATNIQDAVDAAYEGGTVLVTNGVYATGGRTVNGFVLTNRVVVGKVIMVQSVNGPGSTTIQGFQPATTNGDAAIRCIYLTNGAALIGFTLAEGGVRATGDANNEMSGGGIWCASNNVVVSNCVITANSGGGVYQGALNNCMVAGNSGGGASFSTLTNCTLTANTSSSGGGASQCLLVNCILAGNVAAALFGRGGGANFSTLINCAVFGNSVTGSSGLGGGTAFGSLVNCTVTGNTSPRKGNNAAGTYISEETNCIIYYNTSGGSVDNYQEGSAYMDHCCTMPASTSVFATATITNEPLLANLTHISLSSPCRGTGRPDSSIGVDIDGEPWANPPSIGCDELYPGNVIGNISVAMSTSYTNTAPGYTNNFQANILGAVYGSKWDFGDGTVISNVPYVSHSWSTIGDFPVALTAYNDSYPNGQAATLVIHVYQPTTFYVVATNPTPAAPYDSWDKAATNIQNALDVAPSGSLILVSNGVYRTGSRSNYDGVVSRVTVTNLVTLQSVNGAMGTLIDGGQTMRCVYLTNGAALIGFTLTNGNASNGAGLRCESNALVSNCLLVNNTGLGAYSGTISNCVLARNSGGGANLGVVNNSVITNNGGVGVQNAILNNCLVSSNRSGGTAYSILFGCVVSSNSGPGVFQGTGTASSFIGNVAGYGGAVDFGKLTNCLVLGNRAGEQGGGAADGSTLVNCTIVNNSAGAGGGASSSCNLKNCIVYYNTSGAGGNYQGFAANNCCITPLPGGSSVGNFTNPPVFVNNTNDFHLQSNSPCINSGKNAFIAVSNDLDGNPRVQGGTVDVGAYEYQMPGSILSYAWAQLYGLPTDGSVDYLDMDGTGMVNWQKSVAGLNPTNSASVLVMLPPVPTNNTVGVTVSWQSVNTRTYYLQRSTNLAAQPAFISVQSNLVGQTGTSSFTDSTATNTGPYFYRIGVQ